MPEKLPLRVLLVEDSEDDAALLLRELKRSYDVDAHIRVDTPTALSNALSASSWDIVISDHSMPYLSGPDALKQVRSQVGDVPFIIVSGTFSEDAAVEVIKAGANDYFSKHKLARLLPTVERELRESAERHDRQRMEAQLKQAEDRFKRIFHSNPVPCSLSNLETGILLDVNQRFADMFGYTPDAMIGKTMNELNLLLFDKQRDELMDQFNRQGQLDDVEVMLRTSSGELVVGLLSAERVDFGAEASLINMFHDITERKRSEDALRTSEQRFRSLIENSYDGIVLLDAGGYLHYLSPSSQTILGYEEDELMAKRLLSFVHPDDTEQVKIDFRRLVKEPARSQMFSYRVRHKDGKWRWIESIASNLLHEPSVGAIVANYRDITERKRIEDVLRESERFAHSTVNALSAHIAILDAQGTIVAVNDAWRKFAEENGPNNLLLQPAIFEGVNYLDTAENAIGQDAEYGWALGYGIRQVLSGDQTTFSLEYPCHSPAEQRWFLCRVTRFPGDGPVHVVVAHENITEQKVIEHELAALYNATSVLFKAENVVDLGEQVVNVVVRELGKVNCGLLLMNADRDAAVSVALAGHHRRTVGDAVSLTGPGLIARALRTGLLVYASDVHLDPDYLPADPETRSELVVPLVGPRGVLGALDLQSTRTFAFNERDQRVMTAFAERVAAALETMLLYEEINRYNRELEVSVAQRTAELHNAKEHVEAILNNSSDAIVVVDLNGMIEQANPAFTRLFATDWVEPYGHNLMPLFEPQCVGRLEDALSEAATQFTAERLELQCRRGDGTIFDADVAIAPIVEYVDDQISFVFSLRDITVRKQAEENLRSTLARERELNELKTRFTSMVSHEFRTPLAVIQSAADIVRHYGARMTEDRKTEQLLEIGVQVRRLTMLLDDILAVYRGQSRGPDLQPRPIDLATLLGEVVREIQLTASQHHIQLECSGETMHAVLDPKLLRQAVNNLISNAVKYSPSGGIVRVTVQRQPDQVVIQVADQGIGIPPEDLDHLFDAFHRARNVGDISGTGLGLAIVKQAVEAHQGRITVESTLGSGSVFTLVMPPEVQPGKDVVSVN
jgi:PAS domain S-box-containing protein